MDHSLAPRTRTMYQAHWTRCQGFIKTVLQQEPQLPLAFNTVKLYVAHLHSLGYRQSTIQGHLSAISHRHKIQQLPDPTSGYPATKLLTGIRNMQPAQPDTRRPVTHDILLGLLAALTSCAPTTYDIKLYTSMYTIMYYACLRASEVLLTDTPQHMLTLSHVTFQESSNTFQIKFTSFKHSKHQTPVITLSSTSQTDCPVKALREYLTLRGSAPGPLYINSSHTVTRQQFTRVFQSCLRYINHSTHSYNIHSFRIGRTTDMAQQNVPHSTIQQIGRWNSTAFMKYIRPQHITTTIL